MADGDLILTDVGAVYDEYGTDIARVFPANGYFSKRQAQIYQIAYAANREIMAQVCPGLSFREPNRICREVAFDGLKALGLLDDPADIGRYVWHGTTHHVGLDTHDVGGYEEPMTENMIFTVDAGICLRKWGIGLRISEQCAIDVYQRLLQKVKDPDWLPTTSSSPSCSRKSSTKKTCKPWTKTSTR